MGKYINTLNERTIQSKNDKKLQLDIKYYTRRKNYYGLYTLLRSYFEEYK